MNLKQRKRLLSAVLAFILFAGVFSHVYLLDGLPGTVLSIFIEDKTVYADRYSDMEFKKLVVGDNQKEVIIALGKPLFIDSDEFGRSFFYYSKRKEKQSAYLNRVVIFGRNGRVEKLVSGFVD